MKKAPTQTLPSLKSSRTMVPPALGAVVRSLEENGDSEAAEQIAGLCTPEALANTKAEVREFHNRKTIAQQQVGVIYIDNKVLPEAKQTHLLQLLIDNSKRTSVGGNVFLDKWGTVKVGGHALVAVSIDVLRYSRSSVKRYIESDKNVLGYRVFVKEAK